MISRTPTQAELRATAATWGAKPNAAPSSAKLLKYTPVTTGSGSTAAFLCIELSSGIIVNDLRLIRGKEGLWVAMPSIKMLDRDGQWSLDANQKPTYKPIIEFRDRATRDRFDERVLGLVRQKHPSALGGGDSLV